MNTPASDFPLGQRLLARWGASYIPLMQLAVQLVSFLAASGGVLYILLNVQFTPDQVGFLFKEVFVLVLVANALLVPIMHLATPNARTQLKRLAQKLPPQANSEIEKKAWMEITAFPWRFGLAAALVSIFEVVLPSSLIMRYAGGASTEETIHVAIGGALSAIFLIASNTLLMEYVMIPPRLALLPAGHEQQIGGMAGVKLQTRIVILISALVLITLLMVAPHSYQKAINALMASSGDHTQVIFNLRFQMVAVAVTAVFTGMAFSYFLARSMVRPVQSLLAAMNDAEKGRLTARSAVIGTDEIGTLAIQFNRMVARLESLQGSLEKQVAERTAQLEAVNEVGRAVSAITDPEDLIGKVVNLITDRFGHYYVALFLVDSSGNWAELKSASGEAGRVLREAHHRLEVGGKSMVGSAISQGQARIALDVGAEPVRFDNPLLPYTRSEIALPLTIGDRVIGALDVQSTKQAAFAAQDIETLQNMANQVAITLENARLFQETRQSLREIQNIQRQYLQQAWDSRAASESLEYRLGEESASANEDNLDIPLALRNQIIGRISLSGETEWTSEERAWVESVATQAAIALENARLMEESQRAAHYQRLIAEITSRIWSASTRDSILQTAIKEIGRALNVSEAVIELSAGDTPEAERVKG